jgi:hypothetical protein
VRERIPFGDFPAEGTWEERLDAAWAAGWSVTLHGSFTACLGRDREVILAHLKAGTGSVCLQRWPRAEHRGIKRGSVVTLKGSYNPYKYVVITVDRPADGEAQDMLLLCRVPGLDQRPSWKYAVVGSYPVTDVDTVEEA